MPVGTGLRLPPGCGGNPVALRLARGYGRGEPDAIFAHPRLAAVYNAFDGPRDDLAAYLSIATELCADHVFDVHCGTGSLAILLAGTGRAVVAADPAPVSLNVAKSKDTKAAVSWVHADAARVPAAGADRTRLITPARMRLLHRGFLRMELVARYQLP
jgi:2-polyprenyl-3-methyl-5-hydroxy-6-metoxy-1,4-benzoquinol methylase